MPQCIIQQINFTKLIITNMIAKIYTIYKAYLFVTIVNTCFLNDNFFKVLHISWLHWTALEEWPPTERAIMKPWQKIQKCEVGKVGRPAVGVAITSYTFLPLTTFYVGAKKEAGCKICYVLCVWVWFNLIARLLLRIGKLMSKLFIKSVSFIVNCEIN